MNKNDNLDLLKLQLKQAQDTLDQYQTHIKDQQNKNFDTSKFHDNWNEWDEYNEIEKNIAKDRASLSQQLKTIRRQSIVVDNELYQQQMNKETVHNI